MTVPNVRHPTIIIIGDLADVLQADLQQRVPASAAWNIDVYHDGLAILMLLSDDGPDVVVVQTDEPDGVIYALLDHAKHAWPHTHFIMATDQPAHALQEFFELFGDMPIVNPEPELLSMAVDKAVANLEQRGLGALSTEQLLPELQREADSVSVRVQGHERWGRIHLYRGRLVDAYVHEPSLRGEAAFFELLSWAGATFTLERSYRNLRHHITRPLAALLAEHAARTAPPVEEPIEAEGLEGSAPTAPLAEDDQLVGEGGASGAAPSGEENTAQQFVPATANVVDITPSPLISAEVPSAIKEHTDMANAKETLDAALQTIDGAAAAALVDYSSGMALGTAGSGVNLEVAAAGNTEVVRAKLRTMDALGIKGGIEDILITLEKQYHIIYLIPGQTLFLYLVLNRDQANLAMARYKLKALGSDIKI